MLHPRWMAQLSKRPRTNSGRTVSPIYHRRPKRVRAHIFVAALAFLLARTLEKKLKAAGGANVQRPGLGSLAHYACR